MKITSGSTPEVQIMLIPFPINKTAGTHKAPNIKVAEAAKVIENVQRDVTSRGDEVHQILNSMNIVHRRY